MFGHHVSAHLLVHHVHVGTERDPNSAPGGLGFYRFGLRAWVGSFAAGLRAETARRARAGIRPNPLSHPYLGYVVMAVAGIVLTAFLGGVAGLAAYLGLCGYAQFQILMSDYVQHYGVAPGTARGREMGAGW